MKENLRGLENLLIAFVLAAPLMAFGFGVVAQSVSEHSSSASLYAAQLALWLVLASLVWYYFRILNDTLQVAFHSKYAAAVVVFTLSAILVCGWEAALTALLGLSTAVGFSWSWILSTQRLLKPRGAGAKGIVAVGVLLPFTFLSLPLFAYLVLHDWNALSFLSFVPAIPVWVAAWIISAKARRAARAVLYGAGG